MLAALVDLVLGERCAGCAGPRGPVCSACDGLLDLAPRRCLGRSGCPPVWAAGPYVGRRRSLLLAFKEHRRRALARPLGGALARAIAAATAEGRPPAVVPVPTRDSAVRLRGYDPVHVLAHAAVQPSGRTPGSSRVVAALRHRRRVVDQAGLDRCRRRKNLAGALVTRPRAVSAVRGTRVIVVDDVVTTGATIAEASRALRAAGADVVGAAVFAERA